LVFAYPSVQPVSVAVAAPQSKQGISHIQQTLLELVAAIRDLSDEDDLQCLVFLAGELGILRPTPFYFSRGNGCTQVPQSLVLHHTLDTCLEEGLIGWDNGCLRCIQVEPTGGPSAVHSGISWLAMLVPFERRALTQATLELHSTGIRLLSSQAEVPFRHAITRALGWVEGAEAAERRLNMVRYQLSNG
jgi:hypothetical protein